MVLLESLYVVRVIENAAILGIVTYIAFDKDIDCNICVSVEWRSARQNSRILTFISVGWVCVICHLVCSLLVAKMIDKHYPWDVSLLCQDFFKDENKNVQHERNFKNTELQMKEIVIVGQQS